MKTSLLFGRGERQLDLPEDIEIHEINKYPMPLLEDVDGAIRRALLEPIGSPSLPQPTSAKPSAPTRAIGRPQADDVPTAEANVWLHNGLYTLDESLTPVPDIAAESALGTSWRAGADGGSYIGFNPIIPSKIGSFGGSFNIAGGRSGEVSTMIDLNGDGTIDPQSETGLYVLADVAPGEYVVQCDTPAQWIITAPVTLGEGAELKFWVEMMYTNYFPDRIEVLLSTTTNILPWN